MKALVWKGIAAGIGLTAAVFGTEMTSSSHMARAAESGEEEFLASVDENLPVGGWSPLEEHLIEEDVDITDQSKGPKKTRNVINLSADSAFVRGAGSVGYNALDTQAKRDFYLRMNNAAVSFMESANDLAVTTMNDSDHSQVYVIAKLQFTDLNLTKDEAYQAFNAYDYDHPAYYWISNSIWSSSNYLYLCTEKEYAAVSARNTINSEIEQGVRDYKTLADKVDDPLDKIAVVHDRIVTDVDYAYINGTTNPETAKWAHSVQGVFDANLHTVVCEGYADTFSLIMNYLDIPNYYIVGTAGSGGAGGGGGHAWNAVSADGGSNYMYMDLTWDDRGGGEFYYRYFGMPRSDFETTHFKYKSTNTGYQWLYDINENLYDDFEHIYYNKGGFFFDGYDAAAFAKTITAKTHRFGTNVSYLTESESKMSDVERSMGILSYSYYTVTYCGNTYCLAIEQITAKTDLSAAEISLPVDVYGYTGNAIRPEPEVSVNGVKLIKDWNYTVSYDNNINIGTNAGVAITGQGNFTGTGRKAFTISGDAISDDMVTLSQTKFTYDGTAKKPAVTVHKGAADLVENTDYIVTYSADVVNAGIVTVDIKGTGKYQGFVTKTYTIDKADITGLQIDGLVDKIYNKSPQTQSGLTYKLGGVILPDGDFTLSYADNVNAGTATVTVSGKNFSNHKAETFTITAADLSGAVVTPADSTYEYCRAAITPPVTVALDGHGTLNTADYTVSYSNNTDAGIAVVTVTGKGNYQKSAAGNFRIVKRMLTGADVTVTGGGFIYSGLPQEPAIVVKDGTAALIKDVEYTVSISDSVNAGEAVITIEGAGNNYGGRVEKTYTIDRAPVTVTAKDQTKAYGEADPVFTATVAGMVNGESERLIAYAMSRKPGEDVGTYSITPAGAAEQGNYAVTFVSGILTISKSAAVTAPAARSLTYNGAEQALVTAGASAGSAMEYSLDAVTWSTALPTGRNAGKYTVYYRVAGSANHSGLDVNHVTAEIGRAGASVAKVPAARTGLVYSGQSQALLTAGNTTDGTLQYALGQSAAAAPAAGFSASVPAAAGAGTYYVWYRVVGDANHTDLAAVCVTVTIETGYSLIYDANGTTKGSVPVDSGYHAAGSAVTVSGNTGGMVRGGYVFGGWNTAPDGSGADYAAGDTLVVAANATLYAKWIKGAISLDRTEISLTEKEAAKLTATTVPANAAVTWSSGNPSVVSVDGSGRMTAHAAGMAKITARITVGGADYMASCIVSVAAAPAEESADSGSSSGASDDPESGALPDDSAESGVLPDDSTESGDLSDDNTESGVLSNSGTKSRDDADNFYYQALDDERKALVPANYADESGSPMAIEGKDCSWNDVNSKSYWYEGGVKQGTYFDSNAVLGDNEIRGREIYDAASDGWYWLDAIYDGAKAVGKEVWMPYIYQNEDEWDDGQKTDIAGESDEGMEECVLNAIRNKSGKWVRYDENGAMLKGWVTIEGALAELYPQQAGNVYYYDTRTGLMAKGDVTIGGVQYHFDEVTGARQ